MTYGIVYKKNKHRVISGGKITPVFPYARQAEKYIDNELYGSPYVTIKKLGG